MTRGGMTQKNAKPPRLLRQLSKLPADMRGGQLAIGNFDGVHPGHLQVINNARQMAETEKCPLGVMLFDPHPRQYFVPDAPPFRLTRLDTRARLLAEAGVDFTLALPFDAALANCSAEQFIEDMLVSHLAVKGIVVGHDFHFGKDRRGNRAMLEVFGQRHDFTVTSIAAILLPDSDTPFSSSAIRQSLRDGKPQTAAALMGRPFALEAQVEKGDQRGRTIGFATANMALHDYLRPKFGVYAVRAIILDGPLAGQQFDGVANLGLRPTIGTKAPRLETHLFDFSHDIYDRTLHVALLRFIRPEQKFDALDALKAQISKDSVSAREMLAAHPLDC